MSVQLDPLTGLPVDLTDTTFGQLPLNSQPLNLDDLGALGKQSNWLYPDNIIPTVSHLQAQNTPGANTAQSLSTDGKHSLNVNLAGNSAGIGGGNWDIASAFLDTATVDSSGQWGGNLIPALSRLNLFSVSLLLKGTTTTQPGRAVIGIGDPGTNQVLGLIARHIPQGTAVAGTKWELIEETLTFPGGIQLPSFFPDSDTLSLWVDLRVVTAEGTYAAAWQPV